VEIVTIIRYEAFSSSTVVDSLEKGVSNISEAEVLAISNYKNKNGQTFPTRFYFVLQHHPLPGGYILQLLQRHASFNVCDPDAGTVSLLLGSDSHTTAPAAVFLIYLYWNAVFAGSESDTFQTG